MPQFELSSLQLPGKHLYTLQALLERFVPQAEVWAYGSRVTGGAHEGSDIDLVLRNPVDLKKDISGWEDLKEALQESTIPILVELHLWSRLPDGFHRNIEMGYVVVQGGKNVGGGEVFVLEPEHLTERQDGKAIDLDVMNEHLTFVRPKELDNDG